MALPSLIRIATRQSQLALVQAGMIRDAVHGYLAELGHKTDIELLPMLSTGDKITDRHLLEIGGKGLFTKEIEAALLEGEAHIAMHSLKDMPASMPPELTIAGVLPREDYRDALIARQPLGSLDDLPLHSVVGTSSPRRAAQLRRIRPDLHIVAFRGNVPTRLQKLQAGDVDATILAVAGLRRLGMEAHISYIFREDEMLPAIGQGIIAMQCRTDDMAVREMLGAINHLPSWRQLQAERAVLEHIEGDCHTPLAGLARMEAQGFRVKGLILSDDGTRCGTAEASGTEESALALGQQVGAKLKQDATTIWAS